LAYLGTSSTRLDQSLHALRRYVNVLELPHECIRFSLLDSLASARNIVSSDTTITTGELPEVKNDPKRLAHLFRELLSNASKFSPEQVPTIHISATREGEDFVVSITDNGMGIAPAQTSRIFKPFVRLSGDRFPGTGMGLAIARTIVETWKGRIWVDSGVGSGSTFRFTLPAGDG
jgi:chemotaxis family two-component system sensor kinase Cph1